MLSFEDIKKLGLPEKESKVYWAMFRLGGGFPSIIAKEAGINRATTYEVLERLHSKGLIMKIVQKNKMYFSCAEPEAFQEYLNTREKNLQKQKTEFEKLLPELAYFYSNNVYKPKLYFYENLEGIKQAIFDTLEGNHEEVVGFTSVKKVEETLDERVIRAYVKEKVKRGIRSRYLSYDRGGEEEIDKYVRKYYSRAPKEIVPKFKTVSSDRQALNLINIYGNKISLIDIHKPELMAVIIENRDMADTFRVMFETAWGKSRNT